MDNKHADVDALRERIEQLERKNLFIKRAGSLLLIFVGIFFLLGQAKRGAVLEAEKLILKDALGNVRVELLLDDDKPLLRFYDSHKEVQTFLSQGMLFLAGKTHPNGAETELVMTSNGISADRIERNIKEGIQNKTHRQAFNLQYVGTPSGDVSASSLELSAEKGQVILTASKGEATLEVQDSQGYKTVMGNGELSIVGTGDTRKLSAASMRMFRKSGDLIWRVP